MKSTPEDPISRRLDAASASARFYEMGARIEVFRFRIWG
jgi:hypothetical protein